MAESTSNLAFDRLGAIEMLEERIKRERQDRELRAVMRDVVADARRSSPIERRGVLPPSSSAPAASPPREPTERPLEMPGGAATQRLIEQMCDAMLPHGRPNRPAAPAPSVGTEAAPAVGAALRRRLT
jgi:hypothetical protein